MHFVIVFGGATTLGIAFGVQLQLCLLSRFYFASVITSKIMV
jgi:hypothetical protein